jgi:hypothetical protein
MLVFWFIVPGDKWSLLFLLYTTHCKSILICFHLPFASSFFSVMPTHYCIVLLSMSYCLIREIICLWDANVLLFCQLSIQRCSTWLNIRAVGLQCSRCGFGWRGYSGTFYYLCKFWHQCVPSCGTLLDMGGHKAVCWRRRAIGMVILLTALGCRQPVEG